MDAKQGSVSRFYMNCKEVLKAVVSEIRMDCFTWHSIWGLETGFLTAVAETRVPYGTWF
jgi:hypothetical protein